MNNPLKAIRYEPKYRKSTGVFLGMPNAVYHQHGPELISNSDLLTFNHRPKLFEGKRITGEVQDNETAAKRTGTMVHASILEFSTFWQTYVVLPRNLSYGSRAGKINAVIALAEAHGLELTEDIIGTLAGSKKDEIEEYFKFQSEKIVISPDEADMVARIRENVAKHPIASDLLSRGLPEVAFISEPLELGFGVQCKYDWLNVEGCKTTEGRPYGLDVKSCRDFAEWDREFVKRKYYRQPAFYKSVQRAVLGKTVVSDWFWVVVETSWPYSVMVRHPGPDCLMRGMEEIEADMVELSKCLKSGHFPEPGEDTVHEQTLPDWMLEIGTPRPGIRTGDAWSPMRNYESEYGWEEEQ